jgi:hypothetical protein
MSDREPGQHEDLHGLTTAIEGVSFEVEALNQTLRELLGVVEVGADLDPVPSWVNESSEVEGLDQGRSQYPPPPRSNMGFPAGLVVLATVIGCVLTAVFMLWIVL